MDKNNKTAKAVFGQVEAQSINAKQMSVIETKEEFFTYIKKFVDELYDFLPYHQFRDIVDGELQKTKEYIEKKWELEEEDDYYTMIEEPDYVGLSVIGDYIKNFSLYNEDVMFNGKIYKGSEIYDSVCYHTEFVWFFSGCLGVYCVGKGCLWGHPEWNRRDDVMAYGYCNEANFDELLYCSKDEIATELFLHGGC